ncbi:hypothetical protein [Eleftheria terrae]|uniref:hypothetical protein n=1 Tax=Eleftheria terrae TaxID=1597781 RepID=UPI00263B213D|nr:hypothetical protein [Eleftheria terrae]WKB55965.1 hypothetical protein N7L95_28245 [Eleftheria terrae]
MNRRLSRCKGHPRLAIRCPLKISTYLASTPKVEPLRVPLLGEVTLPPFRAAVGALLISSAAATVTAVREGAPDLIRKLEQYRAEVIPLRPGDRLRVSAGGTPDADSYVQVIPLTHGTKGSEK